MAQQQQAQSPTTVADGFLQTRALIDASEYIALRYITYDDPNYDLDARIARLDTYLRKCYQDLKDNITMEALETECPHICNGVCTYYECELEG